MKLFNTFGRKLEGFKPIVGQTVKFYSCGPTVYDDLHIGNLRTFVFYDTLKRVLTLSGYQVEHVMNITDVGHLTSDADEGEDKLETGAQREGKSASDLAEHYTRRFLKEMSLLNNTKPKYAKATGYINQQIELVESLFERNFAYQTEQAIYFDVSKLADYGKLTGQKLDDKEVAARAEVVTDSAKHNPQDFALWFFKVGRFAKHSLSWPSRWGDGFPGWHLECSAIVHATLGEPIDIHAGGVDLIGTHHTNEIAQTEAAYSKPLAKYWLHSEHLLVNSRKMSKSKSNFVTLADVAEKGYDPLALRLLFLQSHYRSQVNFTWNALDGAKQNLLRLRGWADLRWQAKDEPSENALPDSNETISKIHEDLQNDLNTASALARLNVFIDQFDVLPSTYLEAFNELLGQLDEIFGLRLLGSIDITDEQRTLINDRENYRAEKNWHKSDEIREELENQGVSVRDTFAGAVWQRLG